MGRMIELFYWRRFTVIELKRSARHLRRSSLLLKEALGPRGKNE